MSLDDEIVLYDDYGNWYLTLKLNPKVKKEFIINEVIYSLREHTFKSKFSQFDVYPHWNKDDIILR
ncbi:MAG: hypothetical protein A3K77_07015 [Euryarchaeota archaeon RBG_13_31_8]|nr:MAG: hypothetical protein A3K77_07015 [Euryarchaeota archaeon RBG_13_31_8]